ncbi:pancreatic triacylglycerol lipase-like isoform X2 [Sipha flava]|nr:pancreatic triacylglycerol lipase-like isoform X2 [Sipha flava]
MPSNIHMIGHNLGAHVLGVCGANFYKLTKKKIGRITGLNPKGPMPISPWERLMNLRRLLKKDDAEFVDLIHTAKVDKFPRTTGHVEFYPNGGKTPQPGCTKENIENNMNDPENEDDETKQILELFCSDARSYEYYNESITNKSAFFSKLYDPKTKQTMKNENLPTNHMGHN